MTSIICIYPSISYICAIYLFNSIIYLAAIFIFLPIIHHSIIYVSHLPVLSFFIDLLFISIFLLSIYLSTVSTIYPLCLFLHPISVLSLIYHSYHLFSIYYAYIYDLMYHLNLSILPAVFI